jgi:CDP-diacylglycerol--glycerol-3-phosphate 3-phosphatidyltransferase
MNISNKLTIMRVCFIPFFVIFLLVNIFGTADKYIAVAIFIIASMTDWLDGYLARKNHWVTDFGKFMDPLADKLLVCSGLICFVELGLLPAWIVIIIISREFIISGFRLIAASNGVVIAASYWGKYKTVSQMIMSILLILNLDLPVFNVLEQIFIYLALILTVVSLVDYLVKNKGVFKEGSAS